MWKTGCTFDEVFPLHTLGHIGEAEVSRANREGSTDEHAADIEQRNLPYPPGSMSHTHLVPLPRGDKIRNVRNVNATQLTP